MTRTNAAPSFAGCNLNGSITSLGNSIRALGELKLSPFHLTSDWMPLFADLIRHYQADFLHGYPSALSIFASYVLKAHRDDLSRQVKGVMAISETLFDHQRSLIASAFPHAKITSFYGMSEKVLFATELLDEPGTFELEPLYGIGEIVDDAGAVLHESGATGRLLGTGLLFHGMPFIRYDTGDVAELVAAPSEQNGYRLRVRGIRSRRAQEFLVGRHGELISMTAINIHSAAYASLSAFQFHQSVPGEATLRVIPEPGCTVEDIRPFIAEISAKIGASMRFEIALVERLEQNTRGKTKFIVQELDLAAYR